MYAIRSYYVIAVAVSKGLKMKIVPEIIIARDKPMNIFPVFEMGVKLSVIISWVIPPIISAAPKMIIKISRKTSGIMARRNNFV